MDATDSRRVFFSLVLLVDATRLMTMMTFTMSDVSDPLLTKSDP